MDRPLEQFVHEANLERYEALLRTCREEERRRQLERLLREERAAGVDIATADRDPSADGAGPDQ